MERCKYCGAKLAADGFCSRPCKPGQLEREIAERKDKTPADKQAETA